MAYSSRHKHGNIPRGRITVAIAVIFVLGVDWLIYRQANRTPFPFAGLQAILIISGIWLIVCAIALGMRQAWGRFMVLTILYAVTGAFFLLAIITISGADGQTAVRLKTLAVGTLIYFVAGLFLANSRHVRRLTSRIWE